MARRLVFIANEDLGVVSEISIDFKWFSGYSVSQKQKSIRSMHEKIVQFNSSLKLLEVSTKSMNQIGVALSAFNLKYFDDNTGKIYSIENIFQSSKVFEDGGPYRDLLNVHPRVAKMDERLKTSGDLKHFDFNNKIWELEPKTMFYDWLYINSLYTNENLSKQILDYNAFTDIEFNDKKSINCQARSAALFVCLQKTGRLEQVIKDSVELRKIYSGFRNEDLQISFFDKLNN